MSIGRLIVRALSEYAIEDIDVVAINSPGALETSAHLLKFDFVHGRFHQDVHIGEGVMDFGRGKVRMSHAYDPAAVDWSGTDIVLECTGRFRSRQACAPHFRGGAESVLISAPAEDVDKTIVFGVNHETLTADDRLVSCASCTTNCLAPIAKVPLDSVGIKRGFMTTVHSHTQDQRILDNSHSDLYRARAAALNIIPTSTGAAKAVGVVLPALGGRLSGSAVRVPTANVSMIDLAFQPELRTTSDDVNALMLEAAKGSMRGVISYSTQPLVSSDLNHDPHSAIFASPLTKVLDGDLVKIVAWYDNEWGFANRMISVARAMHARKRDRAHI